MLCAGCQVHTGPVLETGFCCYTTKLGKFSLRNGITPHSRTWVCITTLFSIHLGVCVSHSPCGDVRQSCDIGTQFPSPLSQSDQLIWDIVVHCCHGMALECLWNVLMMFVDPASVSTHEYSFFNLLQLS